MSNAKEKVFFEIELLSLYAKAAKTYYEGVSFNRGSINANKAAADEITPSKPTDPGLMFTKPRAVIGIRTSHAFFTVSTITSL